MSEVAEAREELARRLAGIGVFDWDLATGELTWDDRLLELFGYERADFGGTIEAFNARVHPHDLPRVSQALDDAIATGGEYGAEFRIVLPGGGTRWIGARGRVLPGAAGAPGHLLGAAYDTTAHRELAERSARRAALIARVTSELTSTLDPEEGVTRLAPLLVPEVADWCVITLVGDDDPQADTPGDWRRGLRDVTSWHADPELRPLLERYTRVRMASLTDESFVAEALRTGRPAVVSTEAVLAVANVLVPGEARDLLRELAPSAGACFPLRGRGRTVGLISLFNGPGRPWLTADETQTVEELAGRAGLALDSARLYAQQRRVAEELQRSLLTEPPEPDHVQIIVRYEAAAHAAQVGGDWYDAFLQPDGSTVLVIGDVVGHDTAAAAAMGQVRGLLRGIAVHSGGSPAEVLAGVDRAMQTLQLDTTATAVVARLEQNDDERGRGVARVRWSNAGHPPPFLITPDGAVTMLADLVPDLLLGVDPGIRRGESEIALDRGSTLLLYTDGLVERRDQPLDDGVGSLRDTLADLTGRSLDDLADTVLTRLLPAHREDDVALVGVRLHRRDRPRPPEAGPNRVPPNVPDAPPVDPAAGHGGP